MLIDDVKAFTGYVVAGKKNCPRCVEAVSILTDSGQDFMYVDVSDPEAESVLVFLKESLGAREVPQIKTPEGTWVAGGVVGLKEHLESDDAGRELLLG